MASIQQPGAELPPLPPALLSDRPLAWLAVFGPGAVIASLTIGVGELIFSARGGAIFGYRLVFYFLLVLVMKWALVYGSARHMVLTGAHPLTRWLALPGPRGWLPLTMLILAALCFPIWICFHAGTLGTLLASLSGTSSALRNGAHLLWGAGVVGLVLILCVAGGYSVLERTQMVIIFALLGCVVVSLALVQPDWGELFAGTVVPQPLSYPAWINMASHPDIASRPVWVEVSTYVGVIGGSSYDYLAYTSYLREKKWGRAGNVLRPGDSSGMITGPLTEVERRWLRAPLVDCTLSFLMVFVFCVVFVACGALVLGPQHKVPDGTNLLALQAEFVVNIHPWLGPLYFAGAWLAVFGTLYGTIEVLPAIVQEIVPAISRRGVLGAAKRIRLASILWAGLGGLGVLLWSFFYHWSGGGDRPPGLIQILTPANLFTGVLGCGVICLLNVWMDRTFLPVSRRMRWPLTVLNLAAGVVFIFLGMKGYWDHSGWTAFLILLGTILVGGVVGKRMKDEG